MPWKKSDEAKVEDAIKDWLVVNVKEDPTEHAAWVRFRADHLNALFVPDNYTVPSAFPPSSDHEQEKYFAAIRTIRHSIHWVGTRAKIPPDNQARLSRPY
jgi:hypothetical protein